MCYQQLSSTINPDLDSGIGRSIVLSTARSSILLLILVSLRLHFVVLVTSLLRRFLPLAAPVEKAPPLGSNASCDDQSPMPSSGESREQSEAEAGS